MAGPDGVERLGIYGFGAAAHIVTQVARHRGQRVFAFTRAGDRRRRRLALDMGAEWTGRSGDEPPEALDAAIIFAPAGELVPVALRAVRKGGTVVCGGIHMTDIPSFPYDILWGERVVRSVANLTRADGLEFLRLAPESPSAPRSRSFRSRRRARPWTGSARAASAEPPSCRCSRTGSRSRASGGERPARDGPSERYSLGEERRLTSLRRGRG